MKATRTKTNWLLYTMLGLVAILMGPPLIYAAGYFALSHRGEMGAGSVTVRYYREQWQITLFKPGCCIEETVTGKWKIALEGRKGPKAIDQSKGR